MAFSPLDDECLALQVRDYEFDQEMQSNQSDAARSLKANVDKKRTQLEEWSASAYGEVARYYPNDYLEQHLLH